MYKRIGRGVLSEELEIEAVFRRVVATVARNSEGRGEDLG